MTDDEIDARKKSHKAKELPKTQENLPKKLTRGILWSLTAVALAAAMHLTFSSAWKLFLLYGLGVVMTYAIIYHSIGYWLVQWITEQILIKTWRAAIHVTTLLFSDLLKSRRRKR